MLAPNPTPITGEVWSLTSRLSAKQKSFSIQTSMTPDTTNTPANDEELERQIFAETRASTLIPKTPPTSGSETLVPTAETPKSDEPQASGETVIAPELLDEFAALTTQTAPAASEPESVIIETTQPQVSFETPTPATPPVVAPDPALALTFAPAPDAPFQSSVTVGIGCSMPEAKIYYTLDGTAPDETSTPYSPEKILLTQSAMLSARAFAADKSGAVNSADYVVSKPLWQENEPADPTDATAHEQSDNLTAPDGWQIGAASVRGKLHAHRALWREDAFALGTAQNAAGSWSIIVVSDGAGSAPLSRVGSNIACQIALGDLMSSLGDIETLSDDINADLPRIKAALVGAAQSALQAIRDEAAARNQPVSAFAATLLILVRRAYNQAQLCAAIQVGDGAIALDCASGLKLLGAADHGQHSSETRFLTTNGMDADFLNRVKFSMPTDLRATLVVSDGVSDDYFPEEKRLTEVFEAVTPLAQDADDAGATLLQWLGYEKKGSSDDRTLVLSWPLGNSAVDALKAELAASPDHEAAGLAPSSKPEFAVTPSLEEGASPAPTNLAAAPATEHAISAVAPDAATPPDLRETDVTETRDGV